MSKISFICILFFAFLWGPPLSAQITFSVSMPDVIALGDNYQIQFIVDGAMSGEEFTPPDLSKLDVLLDEPAAKQIRSGRGRYVLTYTLKASSLGRFHLGAAHIKVNGKRFSSSPKTFRIEKVKSLQQGSEKAPLKADRIPESDLFLKAVINKNKVYEQEPILISLYVYSRYSSIVGIDRKPPEFSSFITKEIEGASRPQLSTESANGRLYYKALIWQLIAYPQRSGVLTIPSFGYDFEVLLPKQKNEKDLFEGSDARRVRVPLRCKPIKVAVEPLPLGAPEDFSGLVGNFRVEASLAPSSAYKVGNPIAYTLDVKGIGNANLFTTPDIKFPDTFETYAPEEKKSKETTSSNGVSVHKQIEYLLIPQNEGKVTLPAFELSYFDLSTKQYKRIATKKFSIEVASGNISGKRKNGNDGSKEQTLRPLKKGISLLPVRDIFVGSFAYYGIYICYAVFFVLSLFIYRRNRLRKADIETYLHNHAAQLATKRLKKARAYLVREETDLFLGEILTVMYLYLSHRFSIQASSLNRKKIEEELNSNHVAGELITQTLQFLDEIEQARYAPNLFPVNLPDIYDRAAHLIVCLEKSKTALTD